MNNHYEFNLYICPQCGKFAVMPANEECPFCETPMAKCGDVLETDFIAETVHHIDKIVAQYYKKESYKKEIWKAREKSESRMAIAHDRLVWEESLKKAIRICPKCARITTKNYLMDTGHCTYCAVPCVDLSVTGKDYYNPESMGERRICNKIKGETERLGIYGDICLPCSSASAVNTNPLTAGVVPALLTMRGEVAEAKKRLFDFMSGYLPAVKMYCDHLDELGADDALLGKLADIINHIQNVLQDQTFVGQGKAVGFWRLILIEIEQKYFNLELKTV